MHMSYTWNPWHGCYKKSEGCENCYVYFFDKIRGKRADSIYRVKSNFNYPITTDRNGNYKIPSGSTVRVCITSDFFLQEADEWRSLAWDMIKIRSDLMFVLLTKRPERIKAALPNDWNDGWNNVFLKQKILMLFVIYPKKLLFLQMNYKSSRYLNLFSKTRLFIHLNAVK